jgi:hypothetical protein
MGVAGARSPMMESIVRHMGPQVGDHVRVETKGRVVELKERDGQAGALVALDEDVMVWVPAGALVLLRPSRCDGP